jgi:flagellar assembly protein FliH
MTWSSARPPAARARRVGLASATAWAPDELHATKPASAVPTAPSAVPAPSGAAGAPDEDGVGNLAAAAYARGVADGRAQTEGAERERLRSAVDAAEQALEALRADEARWTGAIEENVCALAVAVARQIVGRELRGDPELVAELVRRALEEFPMDQPLVIRVHPADLATIVASTGDASAAAPGRNARWLADARVRPGGCVVEGRERIIDGRVDTALERMYRRLTGNNA